MYLLLWAQLPEIHITVVHHVLLNAARRIAEVINSPVDTLPISSSNRRQKLCLYSAIVRHVMACRNVVITAKLTTGATGGSLI